MRFPPARATVLVGTGAAFRFLPDANATASPKPPFTLVGGGGGLRRVDVTMASARSACILEAPLLTLPLLVEELQEDELLFRWVGRAKIAAC